MNPILDNKTSLTRNDVGRLLKGFLREQQLGGTLYCLNVLEKAQCFADGKRWMVAAFLETGCALNFASCLSSILTMKEGHFPSLRLLAKQICCRGTNYYSMVPDMIARIAGLNDENTLFQTENFCYPRILLLIRQIRADFAGRKDGFYIQTAFAILFNLENTGVHDYLSIWRVARLQRLLILAGYEDALWKMYGQLPNVYQHWNNEETKTWIGQLAALRPILAKRSTGWDKQRLLHVTLAIGLMYGFDVNATLNSTAQDATTLPLPLPPFFYATAPVPPQAAKVVSRASRPTTAETYVRLRMGKTAPSWDSLRSELISVMEQRGMYLTSDQEIPEIGERPQSSMVMQAARFKRRLESVKVLTPLAMRDRPSALCPHVFFSEPAVNSSVLFASNPSLVHVTLAAPHLAVMYESSILQPNSEFMRVVERFLLREGQKNPSLLVGGPFVGIEEVAKVIAYRGFWRAVGLCGEEAASQREPFLLLQRNDLTVVSLFCQTDWVPAEVNCNERRFVWVLEWILRFLLSLDVTYRPCDFVVSGGIFLCMAAYYPSSIVPPDVYPLPEAYVAAMNQHQEGISMAMIESVLHIVSETLQESFAKAIQDGVPASLASVYKSVVIQSIPHYRAQMDALRAFLQIK